MTDTTFIYLLLNLILFPLVLAPGVLVGQLVLNKKVSNKLFFASSYCLGVIFLVIFSSIFIVSPATLKFASLFVPIFFIILASIFFLQPFNFLKKTERKLEADILWLYFLAQIPGLFFSIFLCFPSGQLEEANSLSSMFMTGMPVDILIPYNGSRYILENLNPNSLEVVPSWSFSERGPLMAILNSGLFSFLGLKEHILWLGGSQGLFFLYQSFSIILNLQALFVLILLCHEWFGLRAALLSLLTLISSYFVNLNMMFAWPKFSMASFLLVSFWYWVDTKDLKIPALFSAAAMLLHDSAVFFVLSFIILQGLLALYGSRNERSHEGASAKLFAVKDFLPAVKKSFIFTGVFILALSPWLILKKYYLESSPRLFYMHFFCYLGENVSSVSFLSLLEDYLDKNSILEIIKIKFINLIYPFDLFSSFKTFFSGSSFYNSIFLAHNDKIFRILPSFGFALCVVFLLALFKKRKSTKYKNAVLLNVVSFSSIIFLALISGCKNNTVSHIWAYPACLSFALLVSAYLESLEGKNLTKGIMFLLFSFGIGINFAYSFIYFSYGSKLKPFLHASPQYLFVLGLIFFVYISLIVLTLLYHSKKR